MLLLAHIAEYKTGPGGRLYFTRTGAFGRPVAAPNSNPVHPNSYGRAWAVAREKAREATHRSRSQGHREQSHSFVSEATVPVGYVPLDGVAG